MITMRKSKLLVLTLCMMLSMLFLLGTECSATAYIVKNSSYTVSQDNPVGKSIKSPSSINDLTVYVTAKPNSTNKVSAVAIYKNSTYTGSVVASGRFPGGDDGARIHFTLPTSKTYHALISAESSGTFSGTFSAFY